jgi:molecular chaperone GrpE
MGMTEKKTTAKKKDIDSKKNRLNEKIKNLTKDLREKEDKLLRSYAEFHNYQKRMEKEIQICIDDSRKKYLTELIDLSELLKKAYEDENPKQGLKLILSNLENYFEKENVKSIECKDKKFDHNLHHAVSIIEKDDCEDETVIEEVKKGYLVNDRLLRPSQVIVAKNKKK